MCGNAFFINGIQVSEPYFEAKVISSNDFDIVAVRKNILGLNNYCYENPETGETALEVER